MLFFEATDHDVFACHQFLETDNGVLLSIRRVLVCYEKSGPIKLEENILYVSMLAKFDILVSSVK